MLAMLYFGVRPRDIELGNNVHWSDLKAGLVFNRYAVAYTDSFFPLSTDGVQDGLTIEMAIQPDFIKQLSLSFILLVYDGEKERQLVIGQWRKSLVIMNGSDYSNKRRTPKIYLKMDGNGPHLVSIVSSESGTRVFLDGALKVTKGDLVLRYPSGGRRSRMVVGNSLHGRNPWMGLFQGLAMYDRALDDKKIKAHYKNWQLQQKFDALKADAPRLLYAFSEGGGIRVFDHSGGGVDLIIPPKVVILEKKVLAWPNLDSIATASMVEDVAINFLGFIPLGFLLTITLSRIERISLRRWAVAAVAIAAGFSLCIEVAQIWIPTRDSSLLDLLLNTLGSGVGVGLGVLSL